jgi:hypothetical protein
MLQGAEDPTTKIVVSWIGVVGAVGAALISVIGVVVNVLVTRKNHKELLNLQSNLKDREAALAVEIKSAEAFFSDKLAEKKQEFDVQLEVKRQSFQKELEAIKSDFEDENAERRARRDYDYEARKRLYKECEPLLFRLSEASENALHRIFSIARTARMGDLGPQRESWFQSPGYYMASTIYHLLVPSVIFRLLQNKLTLVDLTVDERISNQYLIAKWLYISFTEDFVLAQITPTLGYEPFAKGWEEKRNKVPEKYWRQGVNLGRLDVAVEGMIKQMSDGIERCLSFGEFETAFYEDLQSGAARFGSFADIFLYFHPAQRPILWRILVVQAHLHAKLMETFMQHGTTGFVTVVPVDFAGADLVKLDWRYPGEHEDSSVILEPTRVARTYLQRRLPTLFVAESNEGKF